MVSCLVLVGTRDISFFFFTHVLLVLFALSSSNTLSPSRKLQSLKYKDRLITSFVLPFYIT